MTPTRRSTLTALAIVATLTLAASGCKKKAPETVPQTPAAPTPIEETKAPEPAPPAAEPFPTQKVDTSQVEQSIDDLNRSGVLKTVYFAYDSNDID